MAPVNTTGKNNTAQFAIWRVVISYGIFASLWILFSDQLLGWLFTDPARLAIASMVKGWLFVLITSGLLYVILSKQSMQLPSVSGWLKAKPEQDKADWLPFIFVAIMLVVPLLGWMYVQLRIPVLEQETFEELQSINLLKAQQIENWLDERHSDAATLQISSGLMARIEALEHHQAQSLQISRVRQRFEAMIDYYGFGSIMLYDGDGNQLLYTGKPGEISRSQRRMLQESLSQRQVLRSELIRNDEGQCYLDWFVPVLTDKSEQTKPAIAAIVLRVYAGDFLFPLVQNWPVQSKTAENLLIKRDEVFVFFLNELRHLPGMPLVLQQSLEPELIATKALLADKAGVAAGNDYRGSEVFAAYRPIKNTDWFLISKIDRDEVFATVWSTLFWFQLIGFGAVALIILALYLYWTQLRRSQQLALLARQTEAEKLIGTLVNNSSDAIYVKDLQGHYQIVNPETARIFGKSVADIVGQKDEKLFPTEQAKMVRDSDRRVTAENRIATVEEKLSTVDGERHYLTTKGPLRDLQDTVIGVFGISRDVTESYLAEQSLRESEARLSQLAHQSRTVIWEVDNDGLYTFVSPVVEAVLGYRVDELVGKKHFYDLHPEEGRDEIRGFGLDMIRKRRSLLNMENRMLHADGSEIWMLSSGMPMYDSNGQVCGYRGSDMDITDRKRDEEALALQAQRASALLKLPAAVDSMDETELMQYGLEQAEQLTGSSIAFAHFVDLDQETVTLAAWSKSTKEICTAEFKNHYPISEAGLWADALRERSAVIINQYSEAIHKTGLPQGHAPLQRLICVPVIEGDLVRLIAGVGNKSKDYSKVDVESLQLIANEIWALVSKRRTEEKLKQNAARMRLAAVTFETQEGIMITDAATRIEQVNKGFSDITGYSPEDVIGQRPSILSSGQHDDEFFRQMYTELSRKDRWQGEIWNRRKSGELYVEWLTITAVRDELGLISNYVATMTDITERKRAEDEINKLAFYDPLTQLPNRRLLYERLKQALAITARSGEYGALLFLDLDNFKTLNDTLGHQVGDRLLKEVASRLLCCVRETDTVARLGGDEFVVMLTDLGRTEDGAMETARVLGEKVLHALAQPYQLGRHDYQCTSSIGASLFSGHYLSVDEVLMYADQAMYQAKEAGRNTLRFYAP